MELTKQYKQLSIEIAKKFAYKYYGEDAIFTYLLEDQPTTSDLFIVNWEMWEVRKAVDALEYNVSEKELEEYSNLKIKEPIGLWVTAKRLKHLRDTDTRKQLTGGKTYHDDIKKEKKFSDEEIDMLGIAILKSLLNKVID